MISWYQGLAGIMQYDAWVSAISRRYHLNVEASTNIIKKNWNPSTQVVQRRVELNISEGWMQRGFTTVICLEPLEIAQADITLDNLRIYVSTIAAKLQSIARETQELQ